MSRIFWDTNLFIYLLESTTSLGRMTRALAKRMEERGDELYASAISLGEVLVRPSRMGNMNLAGRYEQLFDRHVRLIPFDRDAARLYGQIRCDDSIEAPDAIQLACAASADADFFITNDGDLARKRVPRIKIIATLDRVPI